MKQQYKKFSPWGFLSPILASLLLVGTVFQTSEKTKDTTQDKVQKGLDALTGDLIKSIHSLLASDEFEGRGPGTPGGIKATELIAKNFKEAKLKPIGKGDDGEGEGYFQPIGKGKARNCVALLEGTDDKLKDEIVVVGGHHDHLGNKGGGGDSIFNGADDNASGSSTVVSIARAFGEAGIKTKRSILFMTFESEEKGLVGSAYYCKNPIFPMEKHVAMVNLDMVGRNPDKPVNNWGTNTFEGDTVKDLVTKSAEKTGLNVKVHHSKGQYWSRSDQGSFSAKGVPCMFFFTGMHADYHKASDHADKVSYENMEKIGRTALLILVELANMDQVPKATGGK
jgi:Zn-dependent M28 family amino/carboxypeptidase